MKKHTNILRLILISVIISCITLCSACGKKDSKKDETTAAETKAPETKAKETKASTTEQTTENQENTTGKTAAAPLSKETAEWNVLIYLCGTDLESKGGMATNNLEMITNTTPDEKVNVLIETGGTSEWNAKERLGMDIANDKLQRWSYGTEGFTLVDELDNSSMAKYTTLSDFIRWSGNNYPAKKNLLVLWDHGGGSSKGLIVDELHDGATMSLEGLERALKDGGKHFDLIMTDTCLMASLETAQAVKAYADYLLASEEVLPGMGSNYEEWLQSLFDEPDSSPTRLGTNICNSTQVMYAELGDDSNLKGLTFSVIDLQKIDAVEEAFEGYMKEVVDLIPDPVAFGTYLSAVNKTDRYMERDMWDLYDLARRGRDGGISKEAVLKLENAVDEAVVTCIRGSYHPYSHGLSVFLCYNGSTEKLDRFARTCKNPWQMAFLDAVSLKWDAPDWACETAGVIPQLKPELYTVKFGTANTPDNSNQLIHIYSGIQSGGDIRYELQYYDEKHETWNSLGESEDVTFISQSGDTLTYAADFTGKWPAIGDKFLHVTTKDVEGTTVLMQAAVLVPELDDSRLMKLRILAEYPEGLSNQIEDTTPEISENEHIVNYTLAGLWDGYDSSTGLSNRNTFSMADLLGATLLVGRPVYSDYFKQIADIRYYDPMTVDLYLEVKDTVLPPGKYRMRYTIIDMLDRSYSSDFINFIWDGNRAVFEAPIAAAGVNIAETGANAATEPVNNAAQQDATTANVNDPAADAAAKGKGKESTADASAKGKGKEKESAAADDNTQESLPIVGVTQ